MVLGVQWAIQILAPWRVVFRWTVVRRTRSERLTREETAITADTALRLAKFFKTTAAVWTNMKAKYDLEMAADQLAPQIKKIAAYEAA
jgi:plasmid maintenance system antidote protein VapI